MKRLASIVCLIGSWLSLSAQDHHFSQFADVPMHLSPGLTGEFIGPFRATTVYKNQWGVLDGGYTSYGVSLDARFESKKRDTPSKIAAGITVFRDKAGVLNFGRLETLFNFAYRVQMNRKNSINFGIQGGFGQFSIDTEGFEWGNQYTGTEFDPERQGELILFNSSSYTDFSAGVNWHYGVGEQTLSSADERWFNIGMGVNHLSNPTINRQAKVTEELDYRWTYYGLFHIGLKNNNVALEPSFFYSKQGEEAEFTFGNIFLMNVREGSKVTGLKSAIYFGLGMYYRWDDSAIVTASYRNAAYRVGLSYDFTVSSLRNSNNLGGGPEILISYIIPE